MLKWRMWFSLWLKKLMIISKDICRCDLYGDEAVQFPDSPYSMSMVMKEDGKMAWTTL